MIVALAVAATLDSSVAPPLELQLRCPGVAADTESTSAYVSGIQNGKVVNGTATVNRNIKVETIATIEFHGSDGVFDYGDGRVRRFKDAVATPDEITASYKRLGIKNFRIVINRRTGQIRVNNGSAFSGTCEVAPATPPAAKF